jgi:predicted metal-dependent phosphoesterase TrpH
VSDGTLTPTEVVERAHKNGVEMLALTDHDNTDGLREAQACADQLGLQLIPGVEISTSWSDRLFHVVGLGIDSAHQPLQDGLVILREQRVGRAEKIADRLHKAGIEGTLERATELTEGGMITRTHFARVLLERGLGKDMRHIFKHYLVSGKPGYVKMTWADLSEAVRWIHEAGGVAVLAHPLRYQLTGSWLRKVLTAFSGFGGDAIEVVCGSHTAQENMTCAGYAARYQLKGSVGSDFHDPSIRYISLGRLAALPADIEPVWKHW